MKQKFIKGISLVEIMITVTVFAVLGILVTRSVIITLQGSKKSEAQIKVRENINYAFSVMERQLRSAEEIVGCPNPNPQILNYKTLQGQETLFRCNLGGSSHIASGSGRLTSTDIVIDSCSMTCQKESDNYPYKISISVTAHEANNTGIERGNVSMQTEIVGRNY